MAISNLSHTPLTPDLCIVGAGYAGLAMALGAAALGVPSVVIDRDELRTALPRAGDLARRVLRNAARGRYGSSNHVDWDGLRRAAASAAEARASTMSATHLRALGMQVIHGTARFANPDTMEAGGVSIRARRFVLATGAAPAIPRLPGLDTVPWWSAHCWLDVDRVPDSAIVLGAGRTGVEMAQALGRLGCQVTLIESASPLRDFDPELARIVLAQLRREGLNIRAGQTVLRVEPARDGVRLILADATCGEVALEASALILATGWRPSIDDLRLDLARIRCDPSGIAVRPDGRTGNRRVYAIGDVAGQGRSIASAEGQAAIALRSALFRQRGSFEPRNVPRILGTDPEIAVVGVTEAEARGRHGQIGVWRWPYAENDRALADAEMTGHIKVLTTKAGRIIGAGIVGAEAAEGIGLWALAVTRDLNIRDIAALPLPAGTYAEVGRRVALQGAFAQYDQRWLQRAAKLVRWLG